MSLTSTPTGRRGRLSTQSIPTPMLAGVAVGTVAVVGVLFLLHVGGLYGWAGFVVLASLATLAVTTTYSFAVEGRRTAVNRFFSTLVITAFVIAMIPLVLVIGYTVWAGWSRFDIHFFTQDMGNLPARDAGGGILHALIGTLQQVLIASAISVPLGILVALFITEYGVGNRLANATRFVVDVMTGLPSIVAGLFVLSFWVLALNQGFSGFAVSLALIILMLPTVVRSSEEMILLVPNALREGAYSLGIPKWKTVLRVVLPTAATGITTGVMLAIARAVGETAPVLLLAGGNDYVNLNPFSGPQSSLSLYVYQQATSSLQVAIDRSWTSALVLVLVVLVLYVGARLLTRRNTLGR